MSSSVDINDRCWRSQCVLQWNESLQSWLNSDSHIWTCDIGKAAIWEICFTVNICHQDLMPIAVFGAENRGKEGGGVSGRSRGGKNWKDRAVLEGTVSLERQRRRGKGMKTVTCNSFCNVCVCASMALNVAAYVCLLAGCVSSSINVPGLISHTTLCSSLADGTT